MKRLLARWLSVTLVLGLLAGCGGGAAPKQDPQPPAAQPAQAQPAQQQPAQKVTLRWFMWTGSEPERNAWEELAADVTKKYPNIEIKFETDSFANFWPKLQTMIAGGQTPDIIGLQSLRSATFASRGGYLPLDEFIKNDKDLNFDDFNKGIINGLSYNGKIYALPYDFGPHIVYYNKTLFDKAGVKPPGEDWTWDDFLSIAKQMTREIDGKQVYGYGPVAIADQYMDWLWSNGGDYIDDSLSKSLLTKPETVEAIQWYADLIHKHKVALPISDPGNTQYHREAFYAGRAAMVIDGPWNFVNVRSKLKDEWDIQVLPKGKAGRIAYLAGSGFGISPNTKYKNEAWLAVKTITSPESLTKLAKAGRAYPARKSALVGFYNPQILPKNQQVVDKQAASGRPPNTNATWEEAQQLIKRELDKTVLANQPAADVLKALDPQLQALVDKAKQIK